nr:hypothetical protein [Actinomycetota bacterium]
MRLASRSHLALTALLMSLVVALTGVGTLATPEASQARQRAAGSGYRFTHAERCLMSKLNRRRANRGLRRLESDKQLGYVGRRHARNMAGAGTTWHLGNLANVVTRWRRLGQTVGRAPRCRAMFRMFWRSSVHRQIMMGSWRFVGVGVERRRGHIYVLQIFESRRNPGNTFSYP